MRSPAEQWILKSVRETSLDRVGAAKVNVFLKEEKFVVVRRSAQGFGGLKDREHLSKLGVQTPLPVIAAVVGDSARATLLRS
jgi:hypothetical protein